MRVLLVHHGRLPSPDAVVSGGALRAGVHLDALRAAGHEVLPLAREQDGPGGFGSPGDLRRLAGAAAPDLIVCVAPEEAPALAGIAPLVVDLYAPRLLEGAFQGLQEEEAGRALAAVEAADQVLYSNPRQRWFWLGILGLAGWDLSREPGLVVPLAALPGPARRRPRRPRFVAGGHPWPWQDLTEVLARAAAWLGDRGEIHTYGLPALPGTVDHGLVPRGEWLAACAGATAALDRYAPNPERALAFSFRQADYLGCGLPLVSDPDGPLADGIRATAAGWVDEPLAEALRLAIEAARDSKGLAARFAPALTEAPLLAWTPVARPRGWSLGRAGGRLAVLEAGAAADRAAREAADREVAAKRAEIEGLNRQVAALVGAQEALAAAMADQASFRKEAVTVLGTRLGGETAAREALAREVAILQADLEKKNLEIEVLSAERGRLDQALRWLKGRG